MHMSQLDLCAYFHNFAFKNMAEREIVPIFASSKRGKRLR